MTSVTPAGRQPLASGRNACDGSVIGVGDGGAVCAGALGVGVGAPSVGAPRVVGGTGVVGVGDEPADVATGEPDDEHATSSTAKIAANPVRTRVA